MSSLKLEFKTESMEYLRPLLRETRGAEETAESIIPDACPDVRDILHTGGMAFLRGKDLGEGTAAVSAGVSAMVLVQPEGRQTPEVIEAYLPMTVRFESAELRPGLESCAQVVLRRLDSHMVNPRKVLVRAAVTVTLRVWERCAEAHPVDSPQEGIQILRRTEPVKLLTALGEKSYTIEDTVRLDAGDPGTCLADLQIALEHTDTRLTGTRAVLKGNVHIKTLSLTEQGALSRGQAVLPFSQYIDLGDCRETDELSLDSVLSGADIELSADGQGLNVTLQLLSRAEVWSQREVAYIGDLYALFGEAEPEWTSSAYESLLDRQCFQPVGRGTMTGGGDQAVYLTCLPGEPSHTRTGDTAEFTVPVSVQMVTEKEGKPAGGTVRVNLTCATHASAGCRFEVQAEDLTATASPGMDGMEVRVTGTICVRTYGSTELREITGGTVNEETRDPSRPGLIIRRPGRQESLWDIARQYRTTTAAIQQANGLSGEPSGEMLLLIPR